MISFYTTLRFPARYMLFDKGMMPRRLKNGASQIGGVCQSLRVSEVFASAYDVRALLRATVALLDGRKLTDLHLPLEKKLMKEMQGSVVEDLLKKYDLI